MVTKNVTFGKKRKKIKKIDTHDLKKSLRKVKSAEKV